MRHFPTILLVCVAWGSSIETTWAQAASPPPRVSTSEYGDFCYGNGDIKSAAEANRLIHNPDLLERLYSDVLSKNARAEHAFGWIETEFRLLGEEMANDFYGLKCTVSVHCRINWHELDFLDEHRPGAAHLRDVLVKAFEKRAKEKGLENHLVMSAVGALGAGAAFRGALLSAEAKAAATSAEEAAATAKQTGAPEESGVIREGSPRVSELPRAGSALKADPHHAFPDVVDNFAGAAKRFELPTRGAGGKIVRISELYQVEGSLNGHPGVFEWIVDQGKITHRRFIPGGAVTGFPNQTPGGE